MLRVVSLSLYYFHQFFQFFWSDAGQNKKWCWRSGLRGVGGNVECTSQSLTRCTGPLQVSTDCDNFDHDNDLIVIGLHQIILTFACLGTQHVDCPALISLFLFGSQLPPSFWSLFCCFVSLCVYEILFYDQPTEKRRLAGDHGQPGPHICREQRSTPANVPVSFSSKSDHFQSRGGWDIDNQLLVDKWLLKLRKLMDGLRCIDSYTRVCLDRSPVQDDIFLLNILKSCVQHRHSGSRGYTSTACTRAPPRS